MMTSWSSRRVQQALSIVLPQQQGKVLIHETAWPLQDVGMSPAHGPGMQAWLWTSLSMLGFVPPWALSPYLPAAGIAG